MKIAVKKRCKFTMLNYELNPSPPFQILAPPFLKLVPELLL